MLIILIINNIYYDRLIIRTMSIIENSMVDDTNVLIHPKKEPEAE